MFYEYKLLCKGGKFRILWIATNRGIHHINYREAMAVDIPNCCNEVMGYVVTNTSDVRKRFSIVLSSKLVHGICLIYRQQVRDVYNQVVKMMQTTPKTCFALQDSESSNVPVSKKRTVKRRKKIELDDDLMAFARIQQAAANEVEEQRAPNEALPEVIRMPELEERVLLEHDERQKETELGDLGRIEDFILFEQNLTRLGDQQIPATEIAEKVPTEVIQEVPVPPVPDVTRLEETERERQQPAVVPNVFLVDQGRKRAPKKNQHLLITTAKSTRVAIDKPNGKNFRVDPFTTELRKYIQLELVKEFFHFSQVIEHISELMEVDQQQEQQNLEAATADNIRRVEQPEIQLEVPVVPIIDQQPGTPRQPVDGIQTTESAVSLMRSLSRTIQSQAGISSVMPLDIDQSGQLRRTICDETPTLTDLPPVTSTPHKSQNEYKFEKVLMKNLKVKKLLESSTELLNILRRLEAAIVDQRPSSVRLTIDQVVVIPVTRKKIACAFSKLLVLKAAQYVELITEEDSLELKYITFGDKFNEIAVFLP